MPLPKIRHTRSNPSDYRSRLPPYYPSASDASRRQWNLMNEKFLPDPAPSLEEINSQISKLSTKKAIHRRIVLASQTGNLKNLRKLMWKHRKVSLNKPYGEPNTALLTPLCWASLNGHTEVVNCLLDGIMEDPDALEMRMLEQLSMVMRGEAAPTTPSSSTLLQSSSSVLSVSQSQPNNSIYLSNTSTWASSSMGSLSQSMTRTANPEIRDSEGRTALMLATYGQHLSIVQSLLDHGAKIMHVDRYGRTAFDFARQSNQNEITQMLKNTLRERRAHELQMKLDEEAKMKEYFAAILRRVAAGGGNKDKKKSTKSNRRKQRPMTAPRRRSPQRIVKPVYKFDVQYR